MGHRLARDKREPGPAPVSLGTRYLKEDVIPYWKIVEGLRLPQDVAGHSALDFCNTLAGWSGPARGEWLVDYDHLVVWVREAGLAGEAATADARLRARRDPKGAAEILRRARSFREDLYAVCLGPRPGEPWERTVGLVCEAVSSADLALRGTRGCWTLPARLGVVLPLYAVGLSALDLLTGSRLPQVGRCPGRDCGWLFLNPTGRRRWCSMSTCGNRAKVRRYAERRSGASQR